MINCGSLATVSEELALVVQLASVNNSSVSPVVTPATLICGVVSLLGDELGSFNVNPLGALGAEVSTIRVTTLLAGLVFPAESSSVADTESEPSATAGEREQLHAPVEA